MMMATGGCQTPRQEHEDWLRVGQEPSSSVPKVKGGRVFPSRAQKLMLVSAVSGACMGELCSWLWLLTFLSCLQNLPGKAW